MPDSRSAWTAADEKDYRFEYLLPSGHTIELPFDIWQCQAQASRRVVKREQEQSCIRA